VRVIDERSLVDNEVVLVDGSIKVKKKWTIFKRPECTQGNHSSFASESRVHLSYFGIAIISLASQLFLRIKHNT
jgi:hypothetical protein